MTYYMCIQILAKSLIIRHILHTLMLVAFHSVGMLTCGKYIWPVRLWLYDEMCLLNHIIMLCMTHLRGGQDGSPVYSLVAIGDLHEPQRTKRPAVHVLEEVEVSACSLQLVRTSIQLPLSLYLVQRN